MTTYNNSLMIFVFVAGIALFVSIFLVSAILNSVYKKKVAENSSRYKELLKINSETKFFNINSILNVSARVESKRQFDNFDYDGYLQHEMAKNTTFFEETIKKLDYNIAENKKYVERINAISKDKNVGEAKKCRVPYEKYVMIEEMLFKEKQLKPNTSVILYLICSYTSPKGRNHYQDKRQYDLSNLKSILSKTKHGIETKSVVAYERALMTDKMRYDVLKRDNFRCKICGRSADDGVVLHVDHIKPVSKGGRTTMSNLRTLCEQCNMGKSNKYDPKGLN